jgi:hypothetical protein
VFVFMGEGMPAYGISDTIPVCDSVFCTRDFYNIDVSASTRYMGLHAYLELLVVGRARSKMTVELLSDSCQVGCRDLTRGQCRCHSCVWVAWSE